MFNSSFATAIGVASVSWDEHGLTRFHLPVEKAVATRDTSTTVPPEIAEIITRAQEHFSGKPQDFTDVALAWSQVTPFQKSVYLETQTIKAGQTASYGEISRRLGLGREGARSIGTALGANPWLLVVPCHRVVAADGRLTGFSAPGGIRTKARLLALEGAELLAE